LETNDDDIQTEGSGSQEHQESRSRREAGENHFEASEENAHGTR